jgi:hypothetical protein
MGHLKRFFRAFDLSLVISRRAQLAQMAARATGLPMGVMYDGGLEVQTAHLVPEFNGGKPAVQNGEYDPVFVMGRKDVRGCLFVRNVAYDMQNDAWISLDSHRHSEPRLNGDLWLRADNYPVAFIRAVDRVRLQPRK